MLDLGRGGREVRGREQGEGDTGAHVLNNEPREDCQESASVGHSMVPSASGEKPQVTWKSRGPCHNG